MSLHSSADTHPSRPNIPSPKPATQDRPTTKHVTERVRVFDPNDDDIFIRMAETPEEIEDAQRLRYQVFYEEGGAKAQDTIAGKKLDYDDYDSVADHLVVINPAQDQKIIGTYRLIRSEAAARIGKFYTESEYDITRILNSGMVLLELGRSCVLKDFRTRQTLQLLWQGIADYVINYNIDLMFGCASLHGTNVSLLREQLSYLHHYHATPDYIRPRALADRFVDMNMAQEHEINPKEAFANLPPLIKGYLRAGGSVGDGAVIDNDFNTTDICIIVQTHLLADRYRRHYERKIQKSFSDHFHLKNFINQDLINQNLQVPPL